MKNIYWGWNTSFETIVIVVNIKNLGVNVMGRKVEGGGGEEEEGEGRGR